MFEMSGRVGSGDSFVVGAVAQRHTHTEGVGLAGLVLASGLLAGLGGVPVAAAAAPQSGSASEVVKAPAVPSVVWVDRASDTSLKLSWRKVKGAKSYRVYRLVKGKYTLAKKTTKLAWTARGLPKRKAQRFRVKACAT
ncbi:MAG: hypothetical protein LBR32_06960, partial [Propionibacteriaceae bacterium]|nr:hypothetical protein [Propionibacteriaceae bacterium]